VTGQDTVEADEAVDTLDLIAGTDMVITTSAEDDSVTFSCSPTIPPIPTAIGDLNDVASTAPTNGYVLTWNSSGSRWDPLALPLQTVNLGDTYSATTATVTASGVDAVIDAATGSLAGVMSAADKTTLDAVASTYVKKAGVFMGRKASLQATTTSLAILAGWASPDKEDAAYTLDTTTGILTFNEDWEGFLNLTLYGVLSVSGRCELYAEVQIDTGSGMALIPGLQMANYAARQTSENEGGLSISGGWFTADSGDTIQVMVRHATSTFRVKGFMSMQQTN
jgi:hypothetical protein